MQKLFISLFALASFSVNAQLPQSFTSVLQSFSEKHRLYYVPENPVQADVITYKFSSDSACKSADCANLKIYFTQDQFCVPNRVGLFGELPANITNAQAIYISPIISDNTSQSHDFMRLKTKGGCYELTMGQQGSNYNDLVDLANRLAMAK